jgi:D-amino-acid dehydrogenase
VSRHVLVIGDGLVGLSSAYYLERAGHRVTVLERGISGHDCCSRGNAGMVVPSHFEPLAAPGMVAYGLKMLLDRSGPFGISPSLRPDLLEWAWLFARSCNADHVRRSVRLLRDLNMESRRLYLEMAAGSAGGFALQQGGLVMLCRTGKALAVEAKLAEAARHLDLRVDVLDRQGVRNLETAIELTAEGGIHFLDDCYLNPGELVDWLHRDLQARGVEFRYDCSVTDFRIDGRTIKAVRSSQGDLAADEIVLAAGAWSGSLARRAGLRLPMQGGKGYSVDLPTAGKPGLCYILVEGRIAVTPMAAGIRFAGTMEIVRDDLAVNRRKYQGILANIPHYLPGFQPSDFTGLEVWSGLRPCSADGLPYLGRPRAFDNLITATGHSMMGVSLAPATGQIVADLVSGSLPRFPLEALRPDRFM